MASARTALFVRKTPGGVFVVNDESNTTGNIFFVDSGSSTNGATAGFGSNPDKPLSTIQAAVDLCEASNSDIIYVMPGHAETVSEAGGLSLDVTGISIIGIGNGSDRPTITLDTVDTADVDVDAANITVENLIFSANEDDIAVCLDVNAKNFTVRRCRFQQTVADHNFLVCIQTGATTTSGGLIVEDCYFLAIDTANTHAVNYPGTPDGDVIRDNIFMGDWGDMCIGGVGVVTNCSVMDNVIMNTASDSDACINFDSSATGLVMGNRCGGGAAQVNGITAAAMALIENYYVDAAVDNSGLLEPAAT